ncbi:MAG: protein disulfide oxidoreductase [Gammaproteobacteria bacterium]|nr:MAG: protein disulfide oxidoreductase [Gammaproteobacteria bacterium]
MPANPKLQLTDYHGQPIDLAKMSKQQPTLIYFWGSWCGICKFSSPKINTLSEQGYPVVSIAVSSGTNQVLANYMNEHGYSFKLINDSDGEIFTNWQGQVTPSYVVLKNGEMKQGLTGIQPVWSLKLRLWLSQYL